MSAQDTIELAGHGLVLREWRDDELEAMVAVFDDPAMAYWTPMATPFDLEAARAHLERVRRRRALGERLHLVITTDGEQPKGEVMLNKLTGTIGYGVGPAYRGQRLAYRAVLLMTEYAHQVEGLAQVSLEIEPENGASTAVARAAGYRLSDKKPQTVVEKGRPTSLLTWVHDA
ncbi:GNAT family N-acetyltransferase [Actinomadura roseirufa]|uniref:GNAT family N-acetyltransferase n=1 Tax=Actinomadura roseirufa TaxID=2094049 RepID=UPI00104174BA|nr:GNAT family N-acetyltransferase [Actinomadura roseirufa]